MQFIVETIKFPIKEVRAASIKTRDGSITIYVDEALTGKERERAIEKLMHKATDKENCKR